MEKQRWEKSRRGLEKIREEKEREERRCKCAKRYGSGRSKIWLAKSAGAEPAGQIRNVKLHAVVARSTCPSQNVQSTSASDHFQKLRWQKTARRCGAKHISKSKCTKHAILGPLLEVEMAKKLHAVVARSTFPSQKCQKLRGSDHFFDVQMSKKCNWLT